MGYVFTKEFEIMTGMLDSRYRLNPTAVIGIFQEMALSHSQALDYSLDWFHKEKKGWMLLDWHIQFHAYPRCHETVCAKTWTSMFKRIQAMRSFELYRGEEKLATALTRWVYMDLDRKRPIRVPEVMADNYSIDKPMAIEPPDFLAMAEVEQFPGCQKESWVVHRRELDFNNHVNNIKYVEWAIDFVPEEIYSSCQAAAIKVSYKKECLLGEVVEGQFHMEKAQDGYHTYFQVCKEGGICCQVWIHWIKAV